VALTARIDNFQQTHHRVGFPLAVVYKFLDDQGGYLAALITYYGFLSLFPLLLLLITILGFVLHGDVAAQQAILNSTLAEFPIVGDQIRENVHSLHGSTGALVVGILGSIYGCIGVAQAGQNAMNAVWSVPRNRRLNPLRSRLRSLAALTVVGGAAVVTTVLSGLVTSAGSFGQHLGIFARGVALVISLCGNLLLFVAGFRMLTARSIGFRSLVPGAVAAAIGWQILQAVGGYYVGHSLKFASQVYGLFAIVLGLLGFLYVSSVVIVLCAELNVVRARRLWPRSLLTPFTDNVTLTDADERSYEALATTQQTKGFEDIDVTFDEHGSE
jgi:membrane protein